MYFRKKLEFSWNRKKISYCSDIENFEFEFNFP